MENTIAINKRIPPVSGSSNINTGKKERIASIIAGAFLLGRGIGNPVKHFGALASGGFLIFRGITGHCAVNNAIGRDSSDDWPKTFSIERNLEIKASPEELYAFWRRLENLPSIMSHLSEVKQLSETRSEWKAVLPGVKLTASWHAEITEDRPNELLAWKSIPGSKIDNAGEVRFADLGEGSTRLYVNINYRPPVGDIGNVAAKLLNPYFSTLVRKDLHELKKNIESHELVLV